MTSRIYNCMMTRSTGLKNLINTIVISADFQFHGTISRSVILRESRNAREHNRIITMVKDIKELDGVRMIMEPHPEAGGCVWCIFKTWCARPARLHAFARAVLRCSKCLEQTPGSSPPLLCM